MNIYAGMIQAEAIVAVSCATAKCPDKQQARGCSKVMAVIFCWRRRGGLRVWLARFARLRGILKVHAPLLIPVILTMTRNARASEGAVVQYFPVPLETRPMMRLDYRPTDRKIKIKYRGDEDQLGELELPPR